MNEQEVKEFLKDFKGGPENIRIGDLINSKEIVEIKNMVNGKATYASTFIVKQS